MIADTVFMVYESTILSFRIGYSIKFKTNKCPIKTIVVITSNLIRKFKRVGFIKN